VIEEMDPEAWIAGLDPSVIDAGRHPGELSGFTCPEYSGPLYGIQGGVLDRFRRRVGHAYTAAGVLEGKINALEEAV
jgi:two-component system chemotaxis response regulator CheB